MSDERCSQCQRPTDDRATGGLCRSCLTKQGKCTACGEPLDPFTRAAYISPGPDKTCLECRESEHEHPNVLPYHPWKKAS
jgi:hypothetical protein